MRISIIGISFFTLVICIFSSCIKDTNPDIPAFIHVQNIQFSVDSSGMQGSASSNIKDAWVSVDGQQLGANTLPDITFPAILDPNITTNAIKVFAGIELNGITNTRAIYPFYEPFSINKTLVPGQTDTFSPVLRYYPDAKIVIIEDFEPTGTVFSDDLDGNPNTLMIRQSNDVKEGNYSGQMVLDSANLECTVATSFKYSNLQPSGTSYPVFLEMDYKTNETFSVGIRAHYNNGSVQTTYIAGVNPKDYWNKIYFDFTETVFGMNAPQYTIVFRALKTVNVAQPEIYVDNIKLVHF